jgi:hypothetical protein
MDSRAYNDFIRDFVMLECMALFALNTTYTDVMVHTPQKHVAEIIKRLDQQTGFDRQDQGELLARLVDLVMGIRASSQTVDLMEEVQTLKEATGWGNMQFPLVLQHAALMAAFSASALVMTKIASGLGSASLLGVLFKVGTHLLQRQSTTKDYCEVCQSDHVRGQCTLASKTGPRPAA